MLPPPRQGAQTQGTTLAQEPGSGGGSSIGLVLTGIGLAFVAGAAGSWWFFKGRHEGLTVKILPPKNRSRASGAPALTSRDQEPSETTRDQEARERREEDL